MCLVLTGLCIVAGAQGGSAKKSSRTVRPAVSPVFMQYYTEGRDTIFTETLDPARVWERMPRQKGRAWRDYYRLVHNFGKVYPYAREAANLIAEVDSTLAATPMKPAKRERYLSGVQDRLFKAYGKSMVALTVSQGALMMKLIDRETHISTYDIIHDYRNGIAAKFWRGIGKLYDIDIESHYDPEGEDYLIEELIQVWESGNYEWLYFTIFGKEPQLPEVKPVSLKTR